MGKPYKLMLVDDEPWALSGMEEIIDWAEAGFSVVARCECGAEALFEAARLSPDAVITDIRMPDMTGLTLIRRLKEQNPRIECVVVSAYSDFDVAREAIRLAAVHYLLKPLSAGDVREAAQTLFKRLSAAARFSVPAVDPCRPVLPLPPDGSVCFLLLSAQPLPDLRGGWQQAVRIDRMHGLLTAAPPGTLPAHCGISLPIHGAEDAALALRSAKASLLGGFSFAPGSRHGGLSAADIQLWLTEHMEEEITLKSLAAQFFLSETYLCDLFKRDTGESIMSFLRRIRLYRAKCLLAENRLPLREIAARCGYSDYSYFGRQFKEEFGVTPNLYRKDRGWISPTIFPSPLE